MSKVDSTDKIMNAAKIVVVVDDDPGVLDSTIMLLGLDGYTAVGFKSGEQLLECGAPDGTICIIMDINLGVGMDGISVIKELQLKGETIPVVIVTGSGDIPTVARAMSAGATTVLEKPSRVDQLLGALRDVQEPGLFYARSSELLGRLTPSERDLVDNMASGKNNEQIAAALGISRTAVDVQRSRIIEKLEASSFAEVVRLVLMQSKQR